MGLRRSRRQAANSHGHKKRRALRTNASRTPGCCIKNRFTLKSTNVHAKLVPITSHHFGLVGLQYDEVVQDQDRPPGRTLRLSSRGGRQEEQQSQRSEKLRNDAHSISFCSSHAAACSCSPDLLLMALVRSSLLQGQVLRPQSSGRSGWGWEGGGLLHCALYGSCNHTGTGSQISELRT